MKPIKSRKIYGVVSFTSACVAALQLEFAWVEAPTPRARFLDFPRIDEVSLKPRVRMERQPARDVAA